MVPSATPWHRPDPNISLTPDEVHVWRVSLDYHAPYSDALAALLSPDESIKVNRYRFPQHQREAIISRGVLRLLLGHYTARQPEQIQLSYTPYGKPLLIPTAASAVAGMLNFNVTHSNGYALYAFTINRDIGIDIEKIRPDAAQDGVAERFFSARELTQLRNLPRAIQSVGFFNCWTRKEAYIKARGEGLSLPLNQFDVSLTPGEPAQLLASRIDEGDAQKWTLANIQPAPGFVGALAVSGVNWQLHCWDAKEWLAPLLQGTSQASLSTGMHLHPTSVQQK